MGQQLFKVQLDPNITNEIPLDQIEDDITCFFASKSSYPNQQISALQTEYIKQIQNDLFLLTKSSRWEQINNDINEQFIQTILTSILDQNKTLIEEQNTRSIYKQELQTSLTTKMTNDKNLTLSIFAQSSSSDDTRNDEEKQEELISYFGLQSLISILLILIRSVEKNDPKVLEEILLLTNNLCEQLPMKCLSSKTNLLFKSLEPFTNYIQMLSSSSTDDMISKQIIQIQLCFSIAKGSFRDILSLLSKLIFNTNQIYQVESLFIQMNNYLTKSLEKYQNNDSTSKKDIQELNSLNYLKSLKIFPDTELIILNKELFTGELISSAILSYIDIENEINESTSKLNSFSYEFHPNTFKSLLNIIQNLSTQSNTINSNHNNLNDSKEYINDDELKVWFDLLLKLISNENEKEITKEVCKCFISIIHLRSLSIVDELDLFYEYLIENKSSILIEEILNELNKNEFLLNWIKCLCDKNKQIKSFEILYLFIDFYFKREEKEKDQIKQILFSFQHLILSQLLKQTETKIILNNEYELSYLINKYLNYIFKYSIQEKLQINDLIHSSLIGLCLMTDIPTNFVYKDIQPIFLSILPLLSQYYLLNINNEDSEFVCCLIGKISNVLIIGMPTDELEIKHKNKFESAVFAGGYVMNKDEDLLKSNLATYRSCLDMMSSNEEGGFQLKDDKEENDDNDFLMSIYNNSGEGAKLISKLKSSAKDKQRMLQKSIEELVNNGSAAMFAVYIKYYRRINLAKAELLRTDEDKPHSQLLSIYQYANRIQSLFTTVKGQGGDCDQLYQQIKMRTLFLLTSIKESHFIPIIQQQQQQPASTAIETKSTIKPHVHRQQSKWTKAKTIVKLLQNLLQACVRFRKFVLEKKENAEEKCDYESVLNRSIDQFIYGDIYKSSTSSSSSSTNEEKQLEINELEKCLHQQHERAMIRLITYQFNQIFIQNILNLNNNEQSLKILSIYLPYLRKSDVDWCYFDDIQTINNEIKQQISNSYYLIIKQILSLTNLSEQMFYLLNISYTSIDILHLSQYDFIEKLFHSFVSIVNQSDYSSMIRLKLIGFDWFRLFVFRLCENIENEKMRKTKNEIVLEKQEKYVFDKLILNEIKSFKEFLTIPLDEEQEKERNSLKNLSFNWFIQSNQSLDTYVNQYLVFVLQSIYFYKNVLSICGKLNYLEEFLSIYYNHQSKITSLLIIKLLRYLIPSIPDDQDGKAKSLIEKFLSDVLNRIGNENTSKEVICELIFMYRTIMSNDSSWKIISTDLVYNSIKSYLNVKSIQMNNSNEINQLRASLCILGGFIDYYRLGSIVKLENNDEILYGIISCINKEDKTYMVQYLETNQIESISEDKLQHETDVLPASVSDSNDSLVDTLGSFIEINDDDESLVLLEFKRRSLCVLHYLLNNKKMIELFMNKSYAPTLAQLIKLKSLPNDLDVFNTETIEEYYLSLIDCKVTQEENKTVDLISTKDNLSINDMTRNELVVNALSKCVNGWKPFVSENEMELFRKGRKGNNEFCLVAMPKYTVTKDVFEECGVKHRFRGRIDPKNESMDFSFPTFIVDGLQLSEGNWYYCIRLPTAGLAQIGWATDGFTPVGSGRGVGDDRCSWSYDGSRAVLFNDGSFYYVFDNTYWKDNDVVGCGIEIDGKNTRIKYWLNGKLLGTAFAHGKKTSTSDTECNLLPNGPNATYYPAVSLSWSSSVAVCELIFSPEDMQECPLPDGYKPLLLPKVVQTENTIVNYPYNAYLIGENSQDIFVHQRTKSQINLLRDFIHNEHIQTLFNLNNNYLSLPNDSDGFILSFDQNNLSSITISFDFEIISTNDYFLLKANSTDISLKTTTTEKQQCIIILLLEQQQIKVYLNNKSQIFDYKFENKIHEKLNVHLLPKISANIKNIGIWKYDLNEDEIYRLFTYGLFFIETNYKELKEYERRINKISFDKNQKEFQNDLLLPFDEPFNEDIWIKKSQESDENESKYLKTNENENYSTVDLFGNKTYLVLNKFNEDWCNYTIVMDISIPQYPKSNERLTLITLNYKCDIYLKSNGKICIETNGEEQESSSRINLNEYFCLFIYLHEESLQIYVNNNLGIDLQHNDNRYTINSDRLNLFKEKDLTQNTTNENEIRVSLKSLIYFNRSISIDEFKSSSSKLFEPSLEVICPNLIAMGYKTHWIESLMKEYQWTNLSTILREQKQQLIERDVENQQKHFIKIFSRISPSKDSQVIEDLIKSSKLNGNDEINHLIEQFFTYLISSQSQSNDRSTDDIKLSDDWFSQTVEGFDISQNIDKWFQNITDKSENENIYELLDLTKLTNKKTKKSKNYSHQNLSSSNEYLKRRLQCEHGLITAYARSTIVHMLKVWSDDQDSSLFPLHKFQNYSILKLANYNEIGKNDKVDRIYLLIKSIVENEMKQLSNTNDLKDIETSLLYYLQKEIMMQIMKCLFKPSDIDKKQQKQEEIDLIIRTVLPTSLINLIFDLFLIVPTNQSRISVIYLFNHLFQLHHSLQIDSRIQLFFFQFFNDLLSDKISIDENIKKKYQVPLVDLIYLLLKKESNPIKEYQSNLPENIQNLLTTVDVIEAWTDPTKQKLLPEKFLEKSNDILGETNIVTQDDFKVSNKDFKITADRELIHLLEESLSTFGSFSDAILAFPTESEPNTSFYARFVNLSSLPVDTIRIRAKFIYLLNKFIEPNLVTIDFSFPSGKSIFTDAIRKVKIYLLYSTKRDLFNASLEKTEASYGDTPTVYFDTVKASTNNEKSENTMFYQAYQQLHKDASMIFRRSNDHLWQAQYVDMHSSDAGGPYRDCITRICLDICSTKLSLFILCPNGRTNSGLNRDCWIPNVFPPYKFIPIKIKKQYRFVGQLLGMAIRRKHYLDVKFAKVFWKKLLKEEITIEDIEEIDAQSFTMINEMEKNIEEIKSMNMDQDIDTVFSSIMSDLKFDIVSSSGQTYELIRNGQNISITTNNFKEYCDLYRIYRLNEFNRQMNYIREGLFSIIPNSYLNLLTTEELEEAVCGKGQIDIEILKRNTYYGGSYEQNSPVIERFWSTLASRFNDEQRKLFLIFVWGRSTLPVRDEDFQSRFTINPMYVDENNVDKTLPISHTCFFTIDLPAYSSEEVMYDRLNYAIVSCSSIDGDGMMNEATNVERVDSDEDI